MNDMSIVQGQTPLRSDDLPETALPCLSVPNGFPAPSLKQGSTSPTGVYEYHNADGTLAFLICRYQNGNRKRFCPFSVWQFDGKKTWVMKMLPGETQVYHLPELLAHPEKPVLLSEGEKCAEIASAFSGFVSTTWRGGASSASKTDFSSLAGRDVIILPDNDEAGAKVTKELCITLTQLGTARLRVFNTSKLAGLMMAHNEAGFDIADAIEAGLDKGKFCDFLARKDMVEEIEQAPTAEVGQPDEAPIYGELRKQFDFVPDLPDGFELTVDGIFKHEVDARGRPTMVRASSPIVVLGRSHLAEGPGGWGYHIAVRTPQSKWECLSIPGRLLASDGRELRELLADLGCIVPQQLKERRALSEYIGDAQNCPIMHVAHQPGWSAGNFALPDVIVTPPNTNTKLLLDMGDRPHYLSTAGTLKEWQELTTLAAPNSRATFALCAALAAPLLRPLGIEGGGFHLYGLSSRGKTTLLMLAGSVWGGGGRDGFVRSWRMTDNGAEGLIADHNDLLLSLDEMTIAGADGLTDLLYMLANGHGKARAKKDGTAARSTQWNTLVLSSGENTISQQIEQGRDKNRLTGGMAVRMVDVPIEVEPGVSFESHAPFETGGAFSDKIKSLSKAHYGHAGRAFVREIVQDREAIIEKAEKQIEWFMQRLVSPDDDPQVRRVARRFALVGSAGLLAVKYGILLISPEQIVEAVTACFTGWKETRGGGQSEEWRSASRHLKHFFETHGPTRFERIIRKKEAEKQEQVTSSTDYATRDRCGYREVHEEGFWTYYVLSAAWERDICGPHSPDLMVKIAQDSGALILGDSGHRKKKVRLPGYENPTRVYAIRPDLLVDM